MDKIYIFTQIELRFMQWRLEIDDPHKIEN